MISVQDIDYIIKDFPDSFLSKHSKLFGYQVYYTLSADTNTDFDEKIVCLSLEDFRNVIAKSFGIKPKDYPISFSVTKESLEGLKRLEEEKVMTAVHIPNDYFNKYEKTKASNVEMYFLQKCLFKKVIKPVKFIEFESTWLIFKEICDICVFKSQVDILGYKVDGIFTLSTRFLCNVPSVAVEIDENGHVGYSAEQEQDRQKVIEAFGTKVVRVKIQRVPDLKEQRKLINEECEKVSEHLRRLFQDMMIDYNPDITEDMFLKKIKECSEVDKGFISMFFKKPGNDEVFRYRHAEIGEWLGLNVVENYKSTRRLVENNLELGTEYRKETKEETFHRLDNFCRDGEGKSIIKVNGGKFTKDNNPAKAKQVNFLVSRLGLYIIVMNSKSPKAKVYLKYFAKVYEASMMFLQSKLSKVVKDNTDIETKKEAVKERITTEIKKKESNLKVTKVIKENAKLLKELTEAEEKYQEIKSKYEKEKEVYEELIKDLRKKNDKLTEKVEVSKQKIKKLEDKPTKTKTKDAYSEEDDAVLENKLKKLLISKLKQLCKLSGVSGYSKYNLETRKDLELMIIETIKKDSEIRKKVKEVIDSFEM